MTLPQGGTAAGWHGPGLCAPWWPVLGGCACPGAARPAGSGRELRPRRGGDSVPGSRSINKPASKLRGAARHLPALVGLTSALRHRFTPGESGRERLRALFGLGGWKMPISQAGNAGQEYFHLHKLLGMLGKGGAARHPPHPWPGGIPQARHCQLLPSDPDTWHCSGTARAAAPLFFLALKTGGKGLKCELGVKDPAVQVLGCAQGLPSLTSGRAGGWPCRRVPSISPDPMDKEQLPALPTAQAITDKKRSDSTSQAKPLCSK